MDCINRRSFLVAQSSIPKKSEIASAVQQPTTIFEGFVDNIGHLVLKAYLFCCGTPYWLREVIKYGC